MKSVVTENVPEINPGRRIVIRTGSISVLLTFFFLLQTPVTAQSTPSPDLQVKTKNDTPVQTWYWPWINVLDGPYISDLSTAVDSHGNIHIAYGAQYLYYAVYKNGQWTHSVVDPTFDTGSPVALALDHLDRPHIIYSTNINAKYAAWDGTKWIFQTLDSGYSWQYHRPDNVAIAIDHNNRPYVFYNGGLNSGNRFAHWNGSQWEIEFLEKLCPSYQEMPVSLAIDSQDRPQLSYKCGGETSSIYHAVKMSTGWTYQLVQDGLAWAYITRLLIDSQDRPHIAYWSSINGILSYAVKSGAGWQIEEVTSQSDINDFGFTMNTQGEPCLAYLNNTIQVACKGASGWTLETAFSETNDFLYAGLSLVFRSPNQPHLVFLDSRGKLQHVFKESSSWVSEVIQTSSSPGANLSLAVDLQKHPHLSYMIAPSGRNGAPESLRLGYSTWVGGEWAHTVIDTNVFSDLHSSIEVDSNDAPHILYAGTGQQLKYASLTPEGWQVQNVLSELASYTSLVLDGNDRPHIAFCTGSGVKYGFLNGTTWDVQLVDSNCGGGNFDGDLRLALDASGHPHISYNVQGKSVKYASWDGSAWNIETVIAVTNDYVLSAMLGLDSIGNPTIVFDKDPADNSNHVVIAATKKNGQWAFQEIDSGPVFFYFDGATDPDGRLAVAYWRLTDNHWSSGETIFTLRYAHWNGESWTVQSAATKDPAGVPEYPGIAFDSAGAPHLAQQNAYIGVQFMYAAGVPGYTLYLPEIHLDCDSLACPASVEP